MRPSLGLTAALGASLVAAGCAPIARFEGPARGAVTAFAPPAAASGPGGPGRPWLVPGSTDRERRLIGTLALPSKPDSAVVIVYGDNRPGERVMTARFGAPLVVPMFRSPTLFVRGLVNLPIAVLQAFLPALDGIRDVVSKFVTHRYTGGDELGVLQAIESGPAFDLVINTGDVVQDGRRAWQWERFVERHAGLRERTPFLASVGNHDWVASPAAAASWTAAIGPPPKAGVVAQAFDLPDSLARFVLLDSNLFCDTKGRYTDSLQWALARDQLAWADSALAGPQVHKFIVIHHPIANSGHHIGDWRADDRGPRLRVQLLDICRRRGVTAVLAGHEHLFHRVWIADSAGARGLWQITTGGGGAPLHRIAGEDRKAAAAQKLPDRSRVTFIGREQSVYHFCRLVLRAGPGRPSADLTAYRVNPDGSVGVIDRVDLTQAPGAP